jgi:adenylate cyclase
MHRVIACLRMSSLRLALLLGTMLSLLQFRGCSYLDLIELRTRDYRFLQRGVRAASPDIVIVAVDDASVEQFGRWPWSRGLVAQLLDRIDAANPSVIGLDIVESESGEERELDLDRLHQRLTGIDDRTWKTVQRALDQGAANDERLAEMLRRSGRVVLGYFFDFQRQADRPPVRLPMSYSLVQDSGNGGGEQHLPQARMVQGNLPALAAAARGVGYFNFFPDTDGSYRRAPLAVRFSDQIALPLALAMLRVYRPQVPLAIRFDPYGVESIRLGAQLIPVARDGQMLINFCGPGKTFRHVSAAEVLSGRVPPEVFSGKIILVGVTATALADIRVTPFGGTFPGVEIHANVLDNILRGDFVLQPGGSGAFEPALVFVLAASLGFLLHYARGIAGALVSAAVLGAYVALSQWAFVTDGWLLNVVYPLLAIGLTYGAITVQQYVVEEREKREIRRAFGLYVSPSLARLASERPETLALGGETRDLTVLFCDIRDFTSIAERLSAETLVELLNHFLGEMTEVIFRDDGMLDKYVGDAIVAVWGAPLPQADHAGRACRAALSMVTRLHSLQGAWQQRGWPELRIGIGINSGPMVVGNMGSVQRLSYTVIGDNVNLGSRLEGLNKLYGTEIMASESTVRAADDTLVTRELDMVRVKGKNLPVRIFEILGPAEDLAQWAELVERFAVALGVYRQRQWEKAITAFRAVLELRPGDHPAELYIERCREMLATVPGTDWDGVTDIDVK